MEFPKVTPIVVNQNDVVITESMGGDILFVPAVIFNRHGCYRVFYNEDGISIERERDMTAYTEGEQE